MQQTIEIQGNRLLVFGGVYSNLEALIELKKKANELGYKPDQIICTGDIIGYCADPSSCVQLVKQWGIHCITGNVEANIRDGIEDCGCNFDDNSRCDLLSKIWYPYAAKNTTSDDIQFLEKLPTQINFTIGKIKGIVIHGNLNNINEFVWRSTPWTHKAKAFKASEANIVLAGHSGLPFLHTNKKQHWINSGALGMPANDGQPQVWFATIDIINDQVITNFHSLKYDYKRTRKKMISQKLPLSYALTIQNGIWDNTEIMNKTEAEQTGIKITNQQLLSNSKDTATTKSPHTPIQNKRMSHEYYDPKDLKQFGKIAEHQPEMAKQFFDWYENATHGDTALTQREKALIALAVSHAIECPYCIDAYTVNSLQSGADEEQMMEAVHVAAAIKAGTTLIYSRQMMRKTEKLTF